MSGFRRPNINFDNNNNTNNNQPNQSNPPIQPIQQQNQQNSNIHNYPIQSNSSIQNDVTPITSTPQPTSLSSTIPPDQNSTNSTHQSPNDIPPTGTLSHTIISLLCELYDTTFSDRSHFMYLKQQIESLLITIPPDELDSKTISQQLLHGLTGVRGDILWAYGGIWRVWANSHPEHAILYAYGDPTIFQSLINAIIDRDNIVLVDNIIAPLQQNETLRFETLTNGFFEFPPPDGSNGTITPTINENNTSQSNQLNSNGIGNKPLPHQYTQQNEKPYTLFTYLNLKQYNINEYNIAQYMNTILRANYFQLRLFNEHLDIEELFHYILLIMKAQLLTSTDINEYLTQAQLDEFEKTQAQQGQIQQDSTQPQTQLLPITQSDVRKFTMTINEQLNTACDLLLDLTTFVITNNNPTNSTANIDCTTSPNVSNHPQQPIRRDINHNAAFSLTNSNKTHPTTFTESLFTNNTYYTTFLQPFLSLSMSHLHTFHHMISTLINFDEPFQLFQYIQAGFLQLSHSNPQPSLPELDFRAYYNIIQSIVEHIKKPTQFQFNSIYYQILCTIPFESLCILNRNNLLAITNRKPEKLDNQDELALSKLQQEQFQQYLPLCAWLLLSPSSSLIPTFQHNKDEYTVPLFGHIMFLFVIIHPHLSSSTILSPTISTIIDEYQNVLNQNKTLFISSTINSSTSTSILNQQQQSIDFIKSLHFNPSAQIYALILFRLCQPDDFITSIFQSLLVFKTYEMSTLVKLFSWQLLSIFQSLLASIYIQSNHQELSLIITNNPYLQLISTFHQNQQINQKPTSFHDMSYISQLNHQNTIDYDHSSQHLFELTPIPTNFNFQHSFNIISKWFQTLFNHNNQQYMSTLSLVRSTLVCTDDEIEGISVSDSMIIYYQTLKLSQGQWFDSLVKYTSNIIYKQYEYHCQNNINNNNTNNNNTNNNSKVELPYLIMNCDEDEWCHIFSIELSFDILLVKLMMYQFTLDNLQQKINVQAQ